MSGTVLSAINSASGLGGRGACQGPDEKVGLGNSSPHDHRHIWTLPCDPAISPVCTLQTRNSATGTGTTGHGTKHTDCFPFFFMVPKVGLML